MKHDVDVVKQPVFRDYVLGYILFLGGIGLGQWIQYDADGALGHWQSWVWLGAAGFLTAILRLAIPYDATLKIGITRKGQSS